MRMLVLGAGLQGSACAFDLLRNPDVERVALADLRVGHPAPFLQPDAATGSPRPSSTCATTTRCAHSCATMPRS